MASRSQRVQAQYDAQNAEAAEIILREIERYGGEQSGAVQWARLFMARTGHQMTTGDVR
jgi:hypothetical protein